MTNMQKAKTDKILSRLMRTTTGKVVTRRAWLECQIENGYKTITWEEKAIKDMSRLQDFRATNEMQRAHAARQKAAGMKSCYGLQIPGESEFFEINKTMYNYAKGIENAVHTCR